VESDPPPDAASLERGLVTKLGVACVPLKRELHHSTSALRSDSGVVVVAKLAANDTNTDLISGDVIRSLNGATVTSVDALRSMVDKLASGDAAVLQIERHSQLKYISIEIN
jgi:S1-C subfamily serine protease